MVGGGPAAALLAAACGAKGLDVVVVAPQGLMPSPHTLCSFADDLPASLIAERFERCVLVDDDGSVALPAYARVDNAALIAAAAGVRVIKDTVIAIDGGAALCGSGARVVGRVVVDCTGNGAFVSARQQPAQAVAQTAVGLRVRGPRVDAASFMDWSTRAWGIVDESPPSFLYVLPFADGTVLFEETALAARPAVSLGVLRRRLEARLASRGLLRDIVATELVNIPMNVPLPAVGDVCAFGAAAGLVHPTTGFQVATAWRLAPAVASAIAAARDGSPKEIAQAAWSTLWTPERRATRELLLFALEGALSLQTNREAAAFFRAFFVDDAAAQRWLAGTASPAELRRQMLAMFGAAPWGVRARLLASGKRLPSLFASLLTPRPAAPVRLEAVQ